MQFCLLNPRVGRLAGPFSNPQYIAHFGGKLALAAIFRWQAGSPTFRELRPEVGQPIGRRGWQSMQKAKKLKEYYARLPNIERARHAAIEYAVDPSHEELAAILGSAPQIFADEGVLGSAFASELKNIPGAQIIPLKAGEALKAAGFVKQILGTIEQRASGNLIIFGGGTIINLINYAVATFREAGTESRFSRKLIILPTNSMSIADVAYGSLGLLNDDDNNLKNAKRKVIDPDMIILCEAVLAGGDDQMQKEGLVETLKHCLLQDRQTVSAVLEALGSPTYDYRQVFDLAAWGLKLKADVVASAHANPGTNVGLAKNYGHLHATVIEESYEFGALHGDCVIIGLIIDLKLAGEYGLARDLKDSLNGKLRDRIAAVMNKLPIAELDAFYGRARRFRRTDGLFDVIELPEHGDYQLFDDFSGFRTAAVDLQSIKGELQSLRCELCSVNQNKVQ